MMTVDTELDELRHEFLNESQEKIDEIRAILSDGTLHRPSADRIAHLAHQLKGAGGSYGYSRISSEAAILERLLERWNQDGAEGVCPDFGRILETLQQEISTGLRDLGSPASSRPSPPTGSA